MSWDGCVALNMGLMCASRVLLVVANGRMSSPEDFVEYVAEIPWENWFLAGSTFKVTGSASSPHFSNSLVACLKVKDGVADRFRQKLGVRPDVDTANPDLTIWLRLLGSEFTLAIDTSGEALSNRGYASGRSQEIEAPLRENLAASLLRLSGWNTLCRAIHKGEDAAWFVRSEGQDGRLPSKVLLSPVLSDPFCGSGTLAIEAALALANVRPNARRPYFAFQKIAVPGMDFEAAKRNTRNRILAAELSPAVALAKAQVYCRKNGIQRNTSTEAVIFASDKDLFAVQTARGSAQIAGVSTLIQFQRTDALDWRPPASRGQWVFNPPYGERIRPDSPLTPESLSRELGNTWKSHWGDWTMWMLTGSPTAAKSVGLRATRSHKVFNGNLPCVFNQFLITARRTVEAE